MVFRGSVAGLEVGLVALVAALAIGACGGSDAPGSEGDAGSTSATGGSAGTDDGVGGTGTAGTAGDAGSSEGFPCENYIAPSDMITDFSVWNSDNTWGDSTSLTGGTSLYDGDGDNDVDALSAAVAEEVLSIAGEIQPGSYAGVVLWFGPCLDASAYDGISFTMSGDPGNTSIKFQAQTSSNYPISTKDSKGECVGEWSSGCDSNSAPIALDGSEEATTFRLPWTDFAGGAPIDTLDPTQLLGVQWHIECPQDDACAPSLTLDDVAFYTGIE